MKDNKLFIFVLLAASVTLYACGSPQSNVDSQATKIAAGIFATQTAEAPNTQATEIAAGIFATQTAEASVPAEGAREWIGAVVNQDGNKILKYTCLAQREQLQESTTLFSAFAVLGQLFSNQSVQIKGDISDLKFETISRDSNQAEVRVFGELRMAVLGSAQAQQVDEHWQMVRENDTWRWCGPNFLTKVEPVPVEVTNTITDKGTGIDQTEYRLVGYDLRQTEITNGWVTYTMGVAIENISDNVIRELSIPVAGAYVQLQNSESNPIEFQVLLRYVYSDQKASLLLRSPLPPEDEIIQITELPPSSLVLDTMSLSTPVDARLSTSWEFSFKVPEGSNLNKLVVPGVEDTDLTNVPTRKDLKLTNIAINREIPLSIKADNNVIMTIDNPRVFIHPQYGKMLAFDVDLENKDLSQNQTLYYEFGVIDPHGTWLNTFMTECDNTGQDGVLPMARVDLTQGQKISGVACNILNPKFNDEEVWFWHTVEELDPTELGLDRNGVMKVKGIEATFDELREGIEMSDGTLLKWEGNKRLGKIIVQDKLVSQTPLPILNDANLLYIKVNERWSVQAIPLNN